MIVQSKYRRWRQEKGLRSFGALLFLYSYILIFLSSYILIFLYSYYYFGGPRPLEAFAGQRPLRKSAEASEKGSVVR